MKKVASALAILSTACMASLSSASESHVQPIVEEIVKTRDAILKAIGSKEANFVTFWDFDGTILDGDCSEGLSRDGKVVYKGLAQLAIESGLSQVYPPNAFEKFWADYQYMDERVGHWLSYPFLVQMLRGAKTSDVQALAEKHFIDVLKNHLFVSSMEIVRQLQKAGIEVHVVSASAEVFVRGGSKAVGIPKLQMHGIRVVSRNGRMTEELSYPVTWADGKTQRIQEVLKTKRYKSKPTYVLAGFGNSYGTDGPFLKWIASQQLPAGKPLSVMINGGEEPEAYKGLFKRVDQKDVVGN